MPGPAVFLDGFFFPLPAGSLRNFFSGIFYRNLMELLEVNVTILGSPRHDWVPLWSC